METWIGCGDHKEIRISVLEVNCLGVTPRLCKICDLGQITKPFYESVSLPIKCGCSGICLRGLSGGWNNSICEMFVKCLVHHVNLCVCSVLSDSAVPGSSVHGISRPRGQTCIPCVSCTAGRFFTTEPWKKHLVCSRCSINTISSNTGADNDNWDWSDRRLKTSLARRGGTCMSY